MLVQAHNRQAHYVIKRTFDMVNAYIANPLLNSISSGFIVRTEVFEIIVNFLVAQLFETNAGNCVKGYFFSVEKRQTPVTT
jgi:hypothetical protein